MFFALFSRVRELKFIAASFKAFGGLDIYIIQFVFLDILPRFQSAQDQIYCCFFENS